MIKTCQKCNKQLKTYPSSIRNGRGKFCSRRCGKLGHKQSKETIEKRILKNTGKKRSNDTKQKMSFSQKGKKHPHSEDTKRKIALTLSKVRKGIPQIHFRGEKNVNWKGGITPVNLQIRGSLEYKLWRKSVFERDGYSCVWCKIKGDGKNLNADHIKPFSLFPELRFAIDNGRTLCIDCHKKTDTYGWKIKNKSII